MLKTYGILFFHGPDRNLERHVFRTALDPDEHVVWVLLSLEDRNPLFLIWEMIPIVTQCLTKRSYNLRP